MKKNSIILTIVIFIITACGGSNTTPTLDLGGIQTQAINTAWAAINQTATASIPTNTPMPTNTLQPTFTPVPDYGSRTLPYPKGMTANLVQEEKLSFNFTVLDVVRGQQAWDVVYYANQFNDPAPVGMEYVIMKIKTEYVGADQGAFQLETNDLNVVSKGRVVDWTVARPCCLQNELMNNHELTLFAGGVAEGIIAWPVSMDDPSPLLVIGLKRDGSGGVFFNINN